MKSYRQVVIIYNPKSTGRSDELAKQFAAEAKQVYRSAQVTMMPTKRAGHAEELAANAAKRTGPVLIVSSSGDGGYNEVVNGVMKSGASAQVTCAVLPAGNANDHSRTMHKTPLIGRLRNAKELQIDLLRIEWSENGKQKVRYAHSYAGLGLTPEVGKELNKYDLNLVKEKVLAVKTFSKLKPISILHAGKKRGYQSLVFSNINRMAKVLTFSDKNLPTDGKFEVTGFREKTKFSLLYKFIKAALWFVRPQRLTEQYSFTTLHKMSMQLDGEIVELQKGTAVTITIAPKALTTLI